MSEEKLEKYWNKVYYDYLEKEEAQELIDYYKNMEQENKQLKIENAYYKAKIMSGNSQLKELNDKIEILGDKE